MRDEALAALAARRLLGWGLLLATAALVLAGLAAGSDGWSVAWAASPTPEWQAIVLEIRAPRTLGAWLVGALLGLSGAVAQGLFRNPLADPYLLGSAAGASLAVVLVLATGTLASGAVVGASFAGALAGIALTLVLARGAGHTTRLLLAGVVVGVMLTAVSDLVTSAFPEALRGRQGFMLGNTAYLGWSGVAWLTLGLVVCTPLSRRLARGLDALALGDDSAASLGLDLSLLRGALIVLLALATGLAVSQAGLIAFVGLVAPHLVRRFAPATHAFVLTASAGMGGVLLLAADVLARSMRAPQELPVGVLTAVLGGGYLLWLLNARKGRP